MMEDWNNEENNTTEGLCLDLLDSDYWLLATFVIPYTNYFKEVKSC